MDVLGKSALFKSTVYTWMMVLRVQDKCIRLQSACATDIEHKDLHQCQHCDEECTEDLIYEVSIKLKWTRGVPCGTRRSRNVRRCACTCVHESVCGPKHPWSLTGLVW